MNTRSVLEWGNRSKAPGWPALAGLDHSKNRWFGLLISTAILLLAFGLRVHLVDEENLNWDESYSQWLVSLPFEDMIQTTADDVHPPLYYLTLRVVKRVAGGGEFATRFPSVLFGTLSVALAYALGRAVGGPAVGLGTMLLMALSRANLGIAQTARNYSLATLFCTGSMWATVLFLRRPKRLRAGVAYGLSVAGALYSFYLSIMVPIATNVVFAYVWLQRKRPRDLFVAWIMAQVVVGVLFLPWAFYAIHGVSTPTEAEGTPVGFFVKFYFVTLFTGVTEDWGGYLPGVLVAVAVVAAGTAVIARTTGERAPRREGLALALASVFVPMLVLFVMTLPVRWGWPLAGRYLPLMSAGFYALCAWSVVALGRRRFWFGLIGAALLAGLAGAGLTTYYDGRLYRDVFDSTVDTLSAQRQPGDAVILHNDKRWTIWTVLYPDSWVGTFYLWQMDATGAHNFLNPIWRHSEAVWVVTLPEALVSDPGQEVRRWLESRARASRSWEFNENTLTVYARTPERAERLDALNPDYVVPRNFTGTVDGLVGVSELLERYPVGDKVIFALYWEQPPENDSAVRVRGDGFERAYTVSAPPPAPTGITRQVVTIPLTPDMPAGNYRLYWAESEIGEFSLRRAGEGPAAIATAIGNPLDWPFGDLIQLRGYDVSTTDLRPGAEIEVTLYWQADAAITERYKVLVYLLGAFNPATNNPLWGQYDGEPFNWQWPTTQWPPGVVLADHYVIRLAENAPPGDYALGVVLYGLVSGERLPIYNAAGELLGDMATLAPITVQGQ